MGRTCTTPLVFPSPLRDRIHECSADAPNIVASNRPEPGQLYGDRAVPVSADPQLGPAAGSGTAPGGARGSAQVYLYLPELRHQVRWIPLVQTITQSADVILTPPSQGTAVTGGQMPAAMNASNPMNIVVQGDLDLTSWHNQGYGLLLVTGTLTYDPDASWYGLVLVIGKGLVVGSHAGTGRIQGAMFVAQTVRPGHGWTIYWPIQSGSPRPLIFLPSIRARTWESTTIAAGSTPR